MTRLEPRQDAKHRRWTIGRISQGIMRYGPIAGVDAVAVGLTYVLAIAVRTGGRPDVLDPQIAPFSIVAAFGAGILQVLGNIAFAVYWRDWSAAAIEDMTALMKSSAVVVATLLALTLVTDIHWIPTGAILAGGSLSLVIESALHLRPRWPQIARAAFGRARSADNLIVYGAGRLGQLLAADVMQGVRDYRIACFVDDDPRRLGSYVRGVRVAGSAADLPGLIDRHHASTVVIAIANPPGGLVRRVMDLCLGRDVRVRRVSGFSLLRSDTAPLQPIGIEELLAREPVDLSGRATREHYGDKRILITGAAGSIGSELARQLTRLSPGDLFLLDTNESGLEAVSRSLPPTSVADIILGDIRDRAWLNRVVEQVQAQVIFHAAAYKHVPILERTPLPGIATNVIGSANVIDAAAKHGVERLVFVSTDKAVEPTSVLGYTKRFGELLTIAHARRYAKDFAVVRFGNVLGSVGSVVPIFTSQIDQGGPVTVTHPEASRYFMTIEEAVGLLIEAGALAMSADLLVLDMGSPVSIAELAERMIRLRGLRTPADIEIRYVGLRPGEKMHEKLVASNEFAVGTTHPRIMRVEDRLEAHRLETLFDALKGISECLETQDAEGALDVLKAVLGIERPVHPGSVPANWSN